MAKKIFNDFEKKIINKMIELDDTENLVHMINILCDESHLLGAGSFEWCVKDEKLELNYLLKLDFQCPKDKTFIKDIQRNLYDFVFLIEYLEDEKYIKLVQKDIDFSKSSQSEYNNIPLDDFISKKIPSILNKDIKILHNLYLLKKHNFLDLNTYEDKKRNLWYVLLTILTMIVSIVGIVVDARNTNKVSIVNTVKIEKQLSEMLE